MGHDGERGRVGFFERDHDTAVRFEEQRHLGERLSDGGWLDEGSRDEIAFVGDECQRLVSWRLIRSVFELLPDGGMNAGWVTFLTCVR